MCCKLWPVVACIYYNLFKVLGATLLKSYFTGRGYLSGAIIHGTAVIQGNMVLQTMAILESPNVRRGWT